MRTPRSVESFDEMGLKEDLLRGIYAYGFEKPSAIQQRGIIPILRGMLPSFVLSLLHSVVLSEFIVSYRW